MSEQQVDDGPCRLCGARVRLVTVASEKPMAGDRTQVRVRRCTNPACESNGPEQPLGGSQV